MFEFLKFPKKQILKKQLEKARKKEWNKNIEHLKDNIIVSSHLGDFQKNKELLNQHFYEMTENEKIEILEFTKKEELKYLFKKFDNNIINNNKDEAHALLADIHARTDEKTYLKYEKILLSKEKDFKNANNGESQDEETMNKKVSIFEKLKNIWNKKLEEMKNVFELLKKEHKGEEFDDFLETQQILQNKSTQTELPEENVSNFENVFGKTKNNEEDILESILKEKDKDKEDSQIKKSSADFELSDKNDKKENIVVYFNPFLRYIELSYIFIISSSIILFFSWLFFHIQFDEENKILGIFNQPNLFSQKEVYEQELTDLNKKIFEYEQKLESLRRGEVNAPLTIALEEIIVKKIDWLTIRDDLDTATLQAFPYNYILHYIQYNTFSGNAETKDINVTGQIIDPSGRVFLLATKLINSINTHPSFYGAEMKTFSKQEYTDEDLEGFSTNFSLKFKYLGK